MSGVSAAKVTPPTHQLEFPVEQVRSKHHADHTGDHKEHPEYDGQQLHAQQGPPALLYDPLLAHQVRGRAVRPVRVHLLHLQADGGQDDEVAVPAAAAAAAGALQREHHSLGDRRHACGNCRRHPEGRHAGQPAHDLGVAG